MASLRRLAVASALAAALVVAAPVAALACGGLVAPGHAEVLRRATTLAAWHDGLEHYVTGFRFAGTADRFGYIVPLPGVPTGIRKAGEWTLERLDLEVNPQRIALFADAAGESRRSVEVLERVRIEALDIVVVRGGGPDVAAWAGENGFDLTPDTPALLQSYSAQGAVFALARFDAPSARERGLLEGQGTVIHFTIPTPAPWIPLRILALGKGGPEVVEADLFVLTDGRPDLWPRVSSTPGMRLVHDAPASPSLLADLRSDRGMRWLPRSGMWLTALRLRTPAGTIASDLSIDGGGPVATPTRPPAPLAPWLPSGLSAWWPAMGALAAAVAMAFGLLPNGHRQGEPGAYTRER